MSFAYKCYKKSNQNLQIFTIAPIRREISVVIPALVSPLLSPNQWVLMVQDHVHLCKGIGELKLDTTNFVDNCNMKYKTTSHDFDFVSGHDFDFVSGHDFVSYCTVFFRESCSRGWKLFMLCTAYFDCSQLLRPYLNKYFQIAGDPKREFQGSCLFIFYIW